MNLSAPNVSRAIGVLIVALLRLLNSWHQCMVLLNALQEHSVKVYIVLGVISCLEVVGGSVNVCLDVLLTPVSIFQHA